MPLRRRRRLARMDWVLLFAVVVLALLATVQFARRPEPEACRTLRRGWASLSSGSDVAGRGRREGGRLVHVAVTQARPGELRERLRDVEMVGRARGWLIDDELRAAAFAAFVECGR